MLQKSAIREYSNGGRLKERMKEETGREKENKAQRLYLIKNLPHACKMCSYIKHVTHTLDMAKNFGQTGKRMLDFSLALLN